jgi:hypothetical protein
LSAAGVEKNGPSPPLFHDCQPDRSVRVLDDPPLLNQIIVSSASA